MKHLIMLCFITSLKIVAAQEYSHDFGIVTNTEMQLKRYEKDTAAEAVVIYDIGKSYFTTTGSGFELTFERKLKIKILNKAGLKYAQFSIPYYVKNDIEEKVTEIKGNTYSMENGVIRTTKLDVKNTFKEKYNENWNFKKFAMPDVKEGSVFEISYEIISPYLFNLNNWEFQHKIPVIYSEYTTRMIPFYEYVSLLQGAKKYDEFYSYVDEKESHYYYGHNYNDKVYYYVMKDLPAFKDESFITSPNDYLIKLHFQLAAVHRTDGSIEEKISTWPKLSESLLDNENLGEYLNDSKKKGKKIIDTMAFNSLSKIGKAKYIYHFVKSNYNWNYRKDKYTDKGIKSFLLSKTGNCADINLFLTGMLNAAGIESYPVLLSTRDNGKVKTNYPFLSYFNYVVVYVKTDSLTVLLDATEPLCDFGMIPSRCLNDYGFVINKQKAEWLKFKSDFSSVMEYDFNLSFNSAKDSIYSVCNLITTGYDAIDYRHRFSSSYEKLKEKFLGKNTISNDTLIVKNLNQIEDPFELDFRTTNYLDIVEDKIIISPFCNTTITENPLKMPVRNYPIDFIYKKEKIFRSTILIPNGYKLFSKHEDLTINDSNVKIIYTIEVQNSKEIKVLGEYEFKKDVYESSEYADLKSYFNLIVEKFNQKLVFIKE